MTTNFSIKSIWAVCAVLIMSIWSSTAGAYDVKSTTASNCGWDYSTTPATFHCSIGTSSTLSGLRNTEANPVAFTVTLRLEAGTVFCTNPADNSIHGQGLPFHDVLITIESGEPISPTLISRNGRFLADIIFSDPELAAALAAAGLEGAECQNSNWIARPIITQMRIFGQIWKDSAGLEPNVTACNVETDPPVIDGATCAEQDGLLNYCELNVADPADAIGVYQEYTCTELCSGTGCNINMVIP